MSVLSVLFLNLRVMFCTLVQGVMRKLYNFVALLHADTKNVFYDIEHFSYFSCFNTTRCFTNVMTTGCNRTPS